MNHSFDSDEDTLLKSIRRYKWKMLPVMSYAVSYIVFISLMIKQEKHQSENDGEDKLSLTISIYIMHIWINSFSLYSVMWMFMKQNQSAYKTLSKVI